MDNMVSFQTYSDIHNINTGHKHDLLFPNANLTEYQKGVYYVGIKLLSVLPSDIK